MQLSDRVAIVTGAASGIGFAIAAALAREGSYVSLADIDDDLGERAMKQMKSINPDCRFIHCDVANRTDAKNLIKQTADAFGGVDILVNNAGFQHVAAIQDFEEDVWDRLLAVMLTGCFLCSRYAVPYLIKNRGGRIINVSSIHGLVGSKFKAGYVAAKHGVIGLTKVLALELAESGVTVNAICPSYVRTPLLQKQLEQQAMLHNIPKEEVISKILLTDSPTKRIIEPEEVADLAVYLASEKARGITGSILAIDGGWTAR